MVAEGLGRLFEHVPGRVVLYLPVAVVRDSAFPLRVGTHVRVAIEGGRVVIEPIPQAPAVGADAGVAERRLNAP